MQLPGAREWDQACLDRLNDPEFVADLRAYEMTSPVLRLDEDIAMRRLPPNTKRRMQVDRNIARFVATERARLEADLGGGDGNGTG